MNKSLRWSWTPAVVFLALVSAAAAQTAPLSQKDVPLRVDSGVVGIEDAIPGRQPQVVFAEIVHLPDAPWLRLRFADVEFAQGSFLRMTSLHDGAHQILDAVSIQQWRHSSAYFNGNAVLVELLASRPGDNRVVIDHVTTQDGDPMPISICDGVDERELSNDPKDARSLPGGCTSFLFNNRHYCLLTAGHCAGSTTDVVEFNVPLQGAGGGWVFSHPDDQYAIDPESKQIQNNPCNNDWSYFGVFPNSNTGLTALQAQGDSYTLADAAPPVSGQMIRIRGYGTTTSPVPPSWNRAQKEHTGPYVLLSGTSIRYRTDTTGGNSGSAVYNHATGEVIGIHTCGGCSASGGSNHGTAIHHSNLQAALANPQGVCAWPAPGPVNNECSDTIVVGEGETPFDNLGASTNGPDEPDMCTFFGDTNIQSDVWFGHIANCTGELTISTCGSSFATKLGVYNFQCPTESGLVIACNAAACATQAEVTIPVVENEAFRIRIGGHQGAQGEGILTITCTPAPACVGDLNADGVVDVSDLLMLLGAWGECSDPSDCPADLNEDGVVDVSDLLILLGAWGECGT